MNLSALLEAAFHTIKITLNDVQPIRLQADLNVLIADWQHLDHLNPLPQSKVDQLLEHAKPLLKTWQNHAPQQSRALFLGIHYWLAKKRITISDAPQFTNELAQFANNCHDQTVLKQLSDMLPIFIAALPAEIKDDPEVFNPSRPWRVIHINYAIIATRSHDPRRMAKAFQALAEELPHEAHSFFDEGMRQMQKVDYPEHIKAVMAQYHTLWQSKGKQN